MTNFIGGHIVGEGSNKAFLKPIEVKQQQVREAPV